MSRPMPSSFCARPRSAFFGVVACAALATSSNDAAARELSTRLVTSGLSRPVYLTAPDGDAGRLFVVEQGSSGTAAIKIVDRATGAVSSNPFISISGLAHQGGEQGLLGLAFHPDYNSNGKFYVNLTVSGTGATHVREYTATGTPGNYLAATSASTSTARTILTYAQPQANHNGGWMGFNPRLTPSTPQYLYIASGDGGGANDTESGHTDGTGNAQDVTNNLLGKMLRIDVNGDDFAGDANRNYAIPSGNPFAAAGNAGDDEIWQYGLRNPWRAGFDRQTGDLYIGDVGQGAREEIDFSPVDSDGGENFGWRLREGTIQTPAAGIGGERPPSNVDPIHDYVSGPGSAAVTGGYVYRGGLLPDWQGTYFFGDSSTGKVWSFEYDGSDVLDFQELTAALAPGGGRSISSVVSFGEDALGELYLIDYDGEIYQIIPEPAGVAVLATLSLALLSRRRTRESRP